MMGLTENVTLVSLEEWKAIRDEVQKTIATLENSFLATDESQTTAPDFARQPLA